MKNTYENLKNSLITHNIFLNHQAQNDLKIPMNLII